MNDTLYNLKQLIDKWWHNGINLFYLMPVVRVVPRNAFDASTCSTKTKTSNASHWESPH